MLLKTISFDDAMALIMEASAVIIDNSLLVYMGEEDEEDGGCFYEHDDENVYFNKSDNEMVSCRIDGLLMFDTSGVEHKVTLLEVKHFV